MKKILLSSAAIVAFAGAASADISWTGSASLGYNDDVNVEDGVFFDADIDVSASTELNNGWTAALKFGFQVQDESDDGAAEDGFDGDNNILLSLTNGTYGLYLGDTEYAAASLWDGVSEMAQDGFSEQDDENVLKVTGTFGDVEVAYSTAVSGSETGQQSIGAAATFGNYDFSLGYQEETTVVPAGASTDDDFNTADVLGLSVGTSFGGADVTFAYAKSGDEDSTGLEVSYPVGDVTLGAFYVSESASDDKMGVSAAYAAGALEAKVYYKDLAGNDEFGLGGTYDLGTGLVLAAGYIGGDSTSDNDFGTYVAADYDLGGGASLLVSYADLENYDDVLAADGDLDDLDTVVGGYELNAGFTVELSLDF